MDHIADEAIVQAAFEKWRAGTYVFAELLAPDVVWTIHGSGPVAGTYRNQKDFIEQTSRPLTSRLATPIAPEVHNIFVDGDAVIIRFDGTTTTTSGAPYRNQFVGILKMKNGLVVNAKPSSTSLPISRSSTTTPRVRNDRHRAPARSPANRK
nr:nuclear transport factor 2 family protein [Rhizobium sp. AB2/73]